MKTNLCALFVVGTLLCYQPSFAENSILMDLHSDEVSDEAAEKLETFSKEQLIQMARECSKLAIRTGEEGLGSLYVFHRILSVAQRKGMTFSDVIELLGDKDTEVAFRMCLSDWIIEEGSRQHVQPSDAIKLLDVLTPDFANKAHDSRLRILTYSAARSICSGLHRSFTQNGLEAHDAEKVKERIREHVQVVSRILSDDQEEDYIIQEFASSVTDYHYSKSGFCDEGGLRTSLLKCSQDLNRSKECRKKVDQALERLVFNN